MKPKGFTLIELLVVVAIIGILATVVLASLDSARSRARDAKRLSDIRTIQTALEAYYLENGTYPLLNVPNGSWIGSHLDHWSDLEAALGTALPVDPRNDSSSSEPRAASTGEYVYSYFAAPSSDFCFGRAYMLVFQLEGKNGNGANDGIEFCRLLPFYSYNSAFVVGKNRSGVLVSPDLSGTNK